MNPILEATRVTKRFGVADGAMLRTLARMNLRRARAQLQAVTDVSLRIARGEVVGLVGESGCGKSTVGRIAAGILQATSGEVRLWRRGQPAQVSSDVHRTVQMVFQNPYGSLNPRMRVDQILSEAAVHHGLVTRDDRAGFVAQILEQVGLDASYSHRYPHEFSGGQRQRIAIARALALDPELLVCDEAVSALDVSIQAQILNLFQDLRRQRDLAYLFISHNLAVVEYLADRVVIMYLGRVVEDAPAEELFSRPNHPYTQALIADAPRIESKPVAYKPIAGEMPSPLDVPPGCPFHPRCPRARAECREVRPALVEISPGHRSACHLNHVTPLAA
jgi:peptide/nickel transport system ATP-binding protein